MSIRIWEREANEHVNVFAERVNKDIDALRAAGLRVNAGALQNGVVIFGQIGRAEPVRDPRTGAVIGESFVDLSSADVAAAVAAHEHAERVRASRPRIFDAND